jgi:hypothetical protein
LCLNTLCFEDAVNNYRSLHIRARQKEKEKYISRSGTTSYNEFALRITETMNQKCNSPQRDSESKKKLGVRSVILHKEIAKVKKSWEC